MAKKLKCWEQSDYINKASLGSLDINHPGMILIKKIADKADHILDIGCGDGTRLDYFSKHKKGTGIDISKNAILSASKKFPNHKFLAGNFVKKVLKINYFDLIYSAFVLEHLNSPEKVILKAIKILKPGGYLVLIAPNYGSPNRASPAFKGSRIKKFIYGLILDLKLPFSKIKSLDWNKVDPLKTPYVMDGDTQVEPYIGSLIVFLKKCGLKIVEYDVCWNYEMSNVKIHQKLIKILSGLNISPFKYWGPHLVVVSQKT